MVIGIETDRSATYDFLLAIHSSHEPLSYHFPYKRRFSIPVKLSPPLRVPLTALCQKVEKFDDLLICLFLVISRYFKVCVDYARRSFYRAA